MPVCGTCHDMCPREERIRRKNKNTVHILERIRLNTNKESSKWIVDEKKMVKEFVRSAAGCNLIITPSALRPPNVLQETIKYLLVNVISDNSIPWPVKYEFISNRLRSVRQDAVVQQIEPSDWLILLPPMIRFHCYAAYMLLDHTVLYSELNIKCLQDCFSNLLDVYTKLEYGGNYDNKERSEMENLFALINIAQMGVLSRYLKIFYKVRDSVSNTILNICKHFAIENFVRVFETAASLPIIYCCIFFGLHANIIRRSLLQTIIYSSSCGTKTVSYQTSKLSKFLFYESNSEFIDNCHHYGISLSNNKAFVLLNRNINVQKQNLAKMDKWETLEKRIKYTEVSNLFFENSDNDFE